MAITRLDSAASIAASATLSYVVGAGTNRCLIVATGYEDGSAGRTVTGVDYGGQAMEQIAQDNTVDSGTATGTSLWFLNDAGIVAASGSVITVTYDTAPSVDEMIHAASYENVEQAGGTTSFPQNATYEQNEELPNPNTTVDLVETDGGLLIGSNSNGNANAYSWTGLTEQTDQADSSSQSSYADRLSTTDSNVDIEATISGTANRHAGCSAEIAEVSGPAFPIVIETTAISNQTSNASSKTDVTSPNGVLADDIVLIFIAIDGDAGNPEANADGFATLTSFPEGADEIYVLWKRSTGSEPANYTVNWTGNEQARFMTVRVSGCITTGDPWDVISSGVSNSASTTNVISRLISTVINTLAIYAVAVDRDRVDAADTITGTGWTEVGISGSSGSANGAGLVVGQNEMPSIEQVEAGTFGTWASDQNASRGFNLKPPAGEAFERTASQTITHSSSVARAASTFNRAVADAQVHASSVLRQGSTFSRTVAQALTHSSVITRLVQFPRTVAQALTHIDSISRAASTFNRIVAQNLTHSSVVTRIGSTFSRTATTILTHIDSIVKVLTLNRTAAQNLLHNDSISRAGSTFNRIGTTILTHIDTVLRQGSVFARTVTDALIHSESVVAVKGAGAFERTASQILTHIDSVLREGSTFARTVAQTLTHSESIARIKGAVRTAVQTLTHSDVAVSEKTAGSAPVGAFGHQATYRRPRLRQKSKIVNLAVGRFSTQFRHITTSKLKAISRHVVISRLSHLVPIGESRSKIKNRIENVAIRRHTTEIHNLAVSKLQLEIGNLYQARIKTRITEVAHSKLSKKRKKKKQLSYILDKLADIESLDDASRRNHTME